MKNLMKKITALFLAGIMAFTPISTMYADQEAEKFALTRQISRNSSGVDGDVISPRFDDGNGGY